MWQLRAFDSSKGGTRHLYCLQNVRLGFSIPPLFNDAWTAWLNTQQHPNRNIPTGVDVPLYYSFTASIGGIRKNWGHINVRYRDGRVWNDSKWFANLSAFESAHSNVKFVGWGESINNIKVIGVNEMITKKDIAELRIGHSEIGGWELHSTHAGHHDEKFLSAWVGKPFKEFIFTQWKDGTKKRDAKYKVLADYPKLKATNTELTKTIDIKDGEIERLNKEIRDLQAELDLVGDDTKNLNAFGELLRWFVARMGRKG
jgi:hypothetical protein